MSDTIIKTKDLTVEGLHCVDCATTIESAVAKIQGVEEVNASFTTGKVRVSYRPGAVGLNELISCVEKIGYRVSRNGQSPAPRPAWRQTKFLTLFVSGIALAAGIVATFSPNDVPLLPSVPGVTLAAALFLLSVFSGAYFFSREALAAVKNRRLTIDVLIALAIVGAIIIGEYLEAASLACLFSLAELLEELAIERARS